MPTNRNLLRVAVLAVALLALVAAATTLRRLRTTDGDSPTAVTAMPVMELDFQALEHAQPGADGAPEYTGFMSALHNRTVRLIGFMQPYDSLLNLQTFMLVKSPTGCEFCPPPVLNQVVLIRQKDGQRRYPYLVEPVEATGVLRLLTPDSSDPAHHTDGFFYVLADAEVAPLDLARIGPEFFEERVAVPCPEELRRMEEGL